MNERRYLIEVLLRARDSLSQNMRNAARAVDEFTKAEKRAGEESKRVEAATHQQITALEQMREARIREKRGLDDAVAARRREAEGMQRAASAYRDQARQVRSSADELRKQRAE